jgi:hypothetical protein
MAKRSSVSGSLRGIVYVTCHIAQKLNAVRLQKPRKQRSDAGDSALTREEAMTISGTLMETIRGTGKRTSAWKKPSTACAIMV